MPQPLGYYGIEFSGIVQTEINSLTLEDLLKLSIKSISNINFTLVPRIIGPENFSIELGNEIEVLSDTQAVGLIRYLCDRIELKLTEQAE